jgi:hypothetical protein
MESFLIPLMFGSVIPVHKMQALCVLDQTVDGSELPNHFLMVTVALMTSSRSNHFAHQDI